MWKMYTPAFSGVRISLPPMPFSRCGTKDKRYLQAFAPEELKNTLDTIGDSFLDIEKMCSMNVYSAEAFAGNILEKVIYTTDQGKLEPQVLNATDSRYDFAFNLLGRYKNTHWKFQKEWRYRMCFFSAEYDMPNLKMKNVTQNEIEDYVRGGLTPPFSYYDLGIHPEYFSKMTITPSPQMSEGNRVLLDCLVEKYNPSARIIKSSLIGLI